uniref:Uncharacterized protein n=1 Tax=Ixodes ricinus TaxID=34613 RepID=A0A6B0UU85_IXORI
MRVHLWVWEVLPEVRGVLFDGIATAVHIAPPIRAPSMGVGASREFAPKVAVPVSWRSPGPTLVHPRILRRLRHRLLWPTVIWWRPLFGRIPVPHPPSAFLPRRLKSAVWRRHPRRRGASPLRTVPGTLGRSAGPLHVWRLA